MNTIQIADQAQVARPAATTGAGFLAGMFLGGLAAAGTALLLAPQPGHKTRADLRQRGLELRGQARQSLGQTASQAGGKARQISSAARERFASLRRRGAVALQQVPAQATAAVEQAAGA